MSKEIIIKSPIKILTERSNCTQLNDGEIGIYQPPYRYKNEDGTLGDFKCKKVQIYTKINGEIRKTNTYKPTNLIHHKEMPLRPFPGEVYYTNAISKKIFKQDFVDGIFYFSIRLDELLYEQLNTVFSSGSLMTHCYFLDENNNRRKISEFCSEIYYGGLILRSDAPPFISLKFVFPISIDANTIGKMKYFSTIQTPYGLRVAEINKPSDKLPTMHGITKQYFRLKKKYYVKNELFIKFKKSTNIVYRRYALDAQFFDKEYSRVGKYCSYYCKRKKNKWKKIHSLPCAYFVKRKGSVMLPLNTKSPSP